MDHKNPPSKGARHEETTDGSVDLTIMGAISDNYDHQKENGAKDVNKHALEVKSPTTQTNSLISHSTASTAPPPPLNTGLQRNDYLQAAPGAVRVPGTTTPDDGTVAIGDSRRNMLSDPTVSSPAADGAPGTNAQASVRPAHQSSTAILSARLVDKPETEAVKAEPMEEQARVPFWKDRRVLGIIGFLVLLAAGLGAGLVFGLNDSSDQSSTVQLVTSPPTSASPSLAPSQSPTEFLEFEAPSVDDCIDIANGFDLLDQGYMNTTSNFTLDLDITLSPDIATILPLLDEIIVALQEEIAPALAQCESSRRYLHKSTDGRLGGRRLALTKYVIGNAFFFIDELEGQNCQAGAEENCYRLLAGLVIYLKGKEETPSSLIGHIVDVFDGGLTQEHPFDVELIGVSPFSKDDDEFED